MTEKEESKTEGLGGLGKNLDKVLGVYDDWATKYEDDVRKWGYKMPEQVAQRMVAYSQKMWGNDVKISEIPHLDAGAGDGLSGEALVKEGYQNVIGIDLSPEMMEIAKKRNVYEKTVVVDLNKPPMPFENEQFQSISCVGTFTYIDEKSGILLDFLRVTRPGGIIVYTSRTDDVDRWIVAEKELEEQGKWSCIEITDPLPYLPGNAEYGDSILVTVRAFQKPK